MFLKFNARDGSKKENSPEICTFEGIRFDADSEFAILSTEHRSHDYLMPMDRDTYDIFAAKLYDTVSRTLMHPGAMAEIVGSPLIRVKHGSLTQWDRAETYSYDVSCL